MNSVPDFNDLSDSDDSGPTAFVIGDPHFKAKNILRTKEYVAATICAAEQYEPDFIVILGDTLDTHEVVRTQPFNLATTFIENLSQIAPTYVLIGNHDYINASQFLTDNHPFNPLKRWKNVTIVDKVITTNINDELFTFCPFVPNGRFLEALNTPNPEYTGNDTELWKRSKCIFAHQEFLGCKMGAITSTTGDKWSEDYPKVISGHIHDEQKIGNVYYPGSSLQHSFGDSPHKYIWFVNFENFDIEKVDLGMKRKRIVYNSVEEARNFDVSILQEEDIKLNIKGTVEEFKAFRKSKEYQNLLRHSVRIVYTPVKEDVETIKSEKKGTDYRSVLYELISKSEEAEQQEFVELFGEFKIAETDSDSSSDEGDDPDITVEDIVEAILPSDTEETVSDYGSELEEDELDEGDDDSDEETKGERKVEFDLENESEEELHSDDEDFGGIIKTPVGESGEEGNDSEDLSEGEEGDPEDEMCEFCDSDTIIAMCEECGTLICDECFEEMDGICQECNEEFAFIDLGEEELSESEAEEFTDEED